MMGSPFGVYNGNMQYVASNETFSSQEPVSEIPTEKLIGQGKIIRDPRAVHKSQFASHKMPQRICSDSIDNLVK